MKWYIRLVERTLWQSIHLPFFQFERHNLPIHIYSLNAESSGIRILEDDFDVRESLINDKISFEAPKERTPFSSNVREIVNQFLDRRKRGGGGKVCQTVV